MERFQKEVARGVAGCWLRVRGRGGLKVAITRLFKNGMKKKKKIDGEDRAICYMAKFGKHLQHGAHNTCIFLSFPRNYL